MLPLNNFDPILFLGITNIEEKNREEISQKLLAQIQSYIIVRCLELIPEQELTSIYDQPQFFKLAEQKIPDFNDQIKIFLEDFKEEFKKKAENV